MWVVGGEKGAGWDGAAEGELQRPCFWFLLQPSQGLFPGLPPLLSLAWALPGSSGHLQGQFRGGAEGREGVETKSGQDRGGSHCLAPPGGGGEAGLSGGETGRLAREVGQEY